MTVICDILLEDPRWGECMDLEALVNAAVNRTVSVAGKKLHPSAEASFSFADDARLHALNAQWRKKDTSTNVLSFPANDGTDLQNAPLLGDVVLAYETIVREAEDEGKTFEQHTTHMIVHGFLHLLGFDHVTDEEADEMENFESKILLELGMPDPWADACDVRKI